MYWVHDWNEKIMYRYDYCEDIHTCVVWHTPLGEQVLLPFTINDREKKKNTCKVKSNLCLSKKKKKKKFCIYLLPLSIVVTDKCRIIPNGSTCYKLMEDDTSPPEIFITSKQIYHNFDCYWSNTVYVQFSTVRLW